MTRRPTPTNTRNGLKWREGRPRWEPSPASRAAGLKGKDLRDFEGAWITDRGVAISICDGRALWADMIRDAARGDAVGQQAAADLRSIVEELAPPKDEAGRLRRALMEDLIDAARVVLADQDAAAGVSYSHGPRTVGLLVDAYFEAVDATPPKVIVKPATRRAYSAQRERIKAKFGPRAVASITHGEVYSWYHDELLALETIPTANLCAGTFGALMTYAMRLDWIASSPTAKLKQIKPPGRLVFWTMEEEQTFTAWCDENGFADVADGVVGGLWAGARLVDLCDANLEEMARAVWRFTPIKTERHKQEAMPSIMPPLRARIDRRVAEDAKASVRRLNATPFLVSPSTGKRHTPRSFYARFILARAGAIAARAVPDTLGIKRHQDTRDTCITRLWEAGVAPARMWPWTGHSQKSVERILRDHYLVLRESSMAELADKLAAWAAKEGVAL
jgi:hypothetical protein